MNADLQTLMEQLRQRSHSMKSWGELMKAARTNLKEKRSPLDAEDRAQIQQCLEILHKSVNVTTSKELFEHIEEIALKTGLSLAPSPSSAHGRFVMSECFFIEIQAKENGVVDKVFINHGQMTCSKSSSLLVSLINDRKWDDVARHLEGLVAGYNIAGEKSVKIEAFNALQSLEHNIETYFFDKKPGSSAYMQIMQSEIGAVRPREAGRSCRLHYLLTPLEQLDDEIDHLNELSLKDIFEKEIGLWIELGMASSSEVVPLISTFRKESGSMSDSNSKTATTKLTALFSLKLSESMVISSKTISEWESLQCRPTVIKIGNYVELVQHKTGREGASFEVVLPDQKHIYIMDSVCHSHLPASLISSIEFSDVNHVSSIIRSLRKEAVFGYVLKSVIGEVVSGQKKSKHHGLLFETTSPRFGIVDCIFESNGLNHVRFISNNFDELRVEILDVNDNTLKHHVDGTKVFKRSWSIPATIRTICKSSYSELLIENHTGNDHDKDDKGNAKEDTKDSDKSSKKRPANDNGSFEEDDFYVGQKKFAKFDAKMAYQDIYRIVNESMPPLVDVRQLQELPDLNLPPKQNLLDLFKEVEIWEVLIPPRPGQKPLKSPAPQMKRPFGLPPFQPQTTQQQPIPSPLFGNPQIPPPAPIVSGIGQQPFGILRSPKPRHLSTTSDTFEEMNELCNLSKAFTDSEIPMPKTSAAGSMASTPVSERPASLGLERKSSIQDTIDSVLGSAFQPGPCGTPVPSSNTAQPSPMGLMEQRQRIISERGGGSIQSISFDQGGDMGNTQHHQLHARSHSLAGPSALSGRAGGNTTTINLDVFDFDKSDQMEMETNMMGPGTLQRWHSFHDMEQFATSSANYPMTPGSVGPPMNIGFVDPQAGMPLNSAVPFRNLNTSTRGGRGSRGGGTGRRRSRKALNVGDRTLELAMKELKKAERISRGGGGTRRPRRARGTAGSSGAVAHVVTSSFSEGDSTKLTLKISQTGASGGLMGQLGPGTQHVQGIFGSQEMLNVQTSSTSREMQMQMHQQSSLQFQQMQQHQQQQQQQQHQNQPQQQYTPIMNSSDLPSTAISSYGINEDSEDAAELAKAFPDSSGGDEILRQQIQALKQQMLSNVNFSNLDDRSNDTGLGGAEKSSEASTPSSGNRQQSIESVEFDPLGGNVFDNLSSGTNFGYLQSEPTSGTPANLSGESLLAKIRANVNVKRRGSLDTVIGKLMADKTAVTTSGDDQTFLTNSNDSIDENLIDTIVPHPKRMRLDSGDQDSGGGNYHVDDMIIGNYTSASILSRKDESSNSPSIVKEGGEIMAESVSAGGGEGIKLVIKKSALKIPVPGVAKVSNVGKPPSSAKLKLDKPLPNGPSVKRASPNVMEVAKNVTQQQQQISGEQKSVLANSSTRGFEILKQKMQEKKLKKQPTAKLANEPGSAANKQAKGEKTKIIKPIVDQQILAMTGSEKKSTEKPAADKTPQKMATGTALVTGTEGITFAKLKGFKIPKIDDSASTKPPSTSTVVPVQNPSPSMTPNQSSISKKPPYHPQAVPTPLPKPILKHSISTPPAATLATLIAANSFVPISSSPSNASPPVGSGRVELSPTFRPYARRTLLPDPMEVNSVASSSSGNTNRSTNPYGMQAEFRDPYGTYGTLLHETGGDKTTSKVQRSPDTDGLVIDDTPKSPNTSLNTSKDSVPSPGFRSTATGGFYLTKDEEDLLMDPQ